MSKQIEIYNKLDAAYKEFLRICLTVKHSDKCHSDLYWRIDDMVDNTLDYLGEIEKQAAKIDEEEIRAAYEDKEPYERLTGHEMGVKAGKI